MCKEAAREAYKSNPEKKKEAARKIYYVNSKYKLFIHFICRCHCPAMDMKKLKQLVNIKIVNFKKENRDPEKTT